MSAHEIRLSPSAINDYQACPLRYYRNYILKLKSDKEKDSTRIGSRWGRCHEILGMVPQSKCPVCLEREFIRSDCLFCDGTGVLPADMMDSVFRYLNWAYETVPEHKTHEQWEVERIKILYAITAYRWLYTDSPFEIVASEVWYDLPVVDVNANRKIPGTRTVGRLDHIVQDKTSGLYYVMERKSTSQSLTTQRYWNYLERNVQTVSYLWAARICQKLGRLEKFGIMRDDPLIEGVWYDVWHKPDIEPKNLSQADSKKFVETGEYFEGQFAISHERAFGPISGSSEQMYPGRMINGVPANITFNKNETAFNIWETPQMYGARLMADMAERPDHYFARREFAISDDRLEAFQQKQAIQAKRIRHDLDKDWWAAHEGSCETPFRCDYKDLCFAGVKIGPLDCPEGFTKLEEKEKNDKSAA